MKQNKTYLHLGVTLIVSACAVLMFYDTFFQSRVLLDFFDKLMSVLSPVIYGLVFAYLLAPIVDFFDRYIQKGLPKVKSSLVRGLSILVTWICVIALIYLMFSILIPELVDSTKTLADNFESYYKTVYNWVTALVENENLFSDEVLSDQVLSALNDYYDKLVKWVTDTVIPQAQVAIVAVTGGIWSVVIFLKNILIGMMISVYLLARKESFAKQSKKILYAILPETPYRRTLRAVAEADRIFSGFVRGKLLDSLIIGILCFICCSIFKFPYTPIISVFVGVTNIIPIFGPFLGAIPSAFLILLVNDLLAHDADARKVADGHRRADETAQNNSVIKFHPANQVQSCKDHPHDGGTDGRAAGDAGQLLFGFRLQFHKGKPPVKFTDAN